MTTVDELITEYKAKDETTPVVERIAKANEKLHSVVQNVMGALAALNAMQQVSDFAGQATEAAKSYEALNSRLVAIVGSADAAARKMKLVEQVAGPSPFTTKQLADAATMLEAFGVNSERALPIIGRLGAAFGAGDEQIQMFARALGELSQGNFIDADVLAAMGLSRSDFAAQGIKFDGSGKLLSSATETMTALETLVNQRFGDIFETMGETAVAKAASLDDAWERVMRAAGDGILKAQMPFMESWSKVLGALTSSGVLEQVVTKLSNAFTGIFGGDSTESVARFAAKVLAFLDILPERIQGIAKFFIDLGKTIADALTSAFNFVGNGITLLVNQVQSLIEGFNPLLEKISGWLGEDFTPMKFERMKFKPLGNIGDLFSGVKLPDISGGPREEEFFRMLMSSMGGVGDIPDNRGMAWLNRGDDQKTMEKIAEFTERTARASEAQVDVTRFLFGGGDLAGKGVSLLDVAPRVRPSGSGPSNPRIDIKASNASAAIEQAVTEIAIEVIGQLRSAGALFGGHF